jgi:pyruvate,water dikinase
MALDIYELLRKFFDKKRRVNLNELKTIFDKFKRILSGNNTILELISQLEDKLSGEYIFDINYLKQTVTQISEEIYGVILNLNYISGNNYTELITRHVEIQTQLENILDAYSKNITDVYVLNYDEINPYLTSSVGGKSANLGEIKNYLKMLTPDGFVLTTYSYQCFMEHNQLWPQINKIYKILIEDPKGSAKQYDEAIETLFNNAELPDDIRKSISKNLNALFARHKKKFNLAVRSSAYGEDDERLSFAGQFESVLNCSPAEIYSAYIKVITSRFKYNIMVYSKEKSLEETTLPMAVGIQKQISASTAGVIYTIDPSDDCIDCLLISASYGLGVSVVSGTANADYFKVSRLDPGQIKERRIGNKNTQIICNETGSIKNVPVEEDLKSKACLSDQQINELTESALFLDRYFKRPLDIEWCFDKEGKLYILQCRPLKLPQKSKIFMKNLKEILAQKEIIMYKKGQVAQRGIAAGKVCHINEDDDPASFPAGGIAVTKYTSPRLSRIIRRAKAIITDVGSSTGHMATVAREFGVPLIVNSEDATKILQNGAEITVDAEENIIYSGIIKELLVYETEAEDVFRELKEYKMLRQLLRKISPLLLIDPKDANFIAKNCQTYHDILRFSHEKSMQELINLNMSSRRFKEIKTKTLKLLIPLDLSVIDLGNGLIDDPSSDKIDSINQIRSVPMRAILEGLVSPGVWSTDPVQFGFGDLMSSITRYSYSERAGKYTGQNLAIISEKYTNLNLRLGYHFNVIDTYVSENINDNYIYFRFVGGVTETKRRHLRAILLKEILEKMNFIVTVTGDLVIARLKKWEADQILIILKNIGKLIGFSRQLDTQMENQESVEKYSNEFFKEEQRIL